MRTRLKQFVSFSQTVRKKLAPEDNRIPTLNEYVRYLRGLGLAGVQFKPETYVDRIAGKLKKSIDIVECDVNYNLDLYQLLRSKRWSGAVIKHCSGWAILVRKDMPWSQRAKTIMHEAEHIVCGHYMEPEAIVGFADGRSVEAIVGIYSRQLEESKESARENRWKPDRSERLVKQEPPEDKDEAEEEAEKRAELGLKAAARGRDIFRADEWLFSERL